MSIIKLLLAAISGFLVYRQIKNENRELSVYWTFVTVYWVLNFAQGVLW